MRGLKNFIPFILEISFSKVSLKSVLAETPPDNKTDFTLYCLAASKVLETSTLTMACWASWAISERIPSSGHKEFTKSRVIYKTAVFNPENEKLKFLDESIGRGRESPKKPSFSENLSASAETKDP